MKPGPKPLGERALSHAERQARYRAAQRAKAVDATLVGPGGIQEMRDKIRDLVLKVERREQDVARLTARNAYLEGELKMQERHITNALKDNIVLKQQLAKKKAAKRR